MQHISGKAIGQLLQISAALKYYLVVVVVLAVTAVSTDVRAGPWTYPDCQKIADYHFKVVVPAKPKAQAKHALLKQYAADVRNIIQTEDAKLKSAKVQDLVFSSINASCDKILAIVGLLSPATSAIEKGKLFALKTANSVAKDGLTWKTADAIGQSAVELAIGEAVKGNAKAIFTGVKYVGSQVKFMGAISNIAERQKKWDAIRSSLMQNWQSSLAAAKNAEKQAADIQASLAILTAYESASATQLRNNCTEYKKLGLAIQIP